MKSRMGDHSVMYLERKNPGHAGGQSAGSEL